MEKLGFDIDDGSAPADHKQANQQEARKHSIQRCIQSLVHACQCSDANCRLPSCQKMKAATPAETPTTAATASSSGPHVAHRSSIGTARTGG
ncbi:CREB-binding protein [Drosophila madeirensis]|uniref:histone acetyltransferase n=1 Tax=Drosophila madeirensis TaxID=30013 RepID=A0AAU9GEV7_DROMD